ncbi:RHS repeat-associated core domain-containing protein [Xanthomonas hyacinthi]|uniref:RHS repeat-associated core domain-containing protein n=1 Tax=Xanthomonas hyacinthi TaxID=56455 RepID=UPI001303F3A0|nr:RHS repeat-associated core domain-containing protein [Xanthomonas hyacinthi]
MLRIRVVKAALRVTAAAAISLLIVFSASAQTVRYVHTDGLGSVVLVTDKDRNIIERSEYEPYGSLLNRPLTDGPGYTGHVMDAATGLAYMQQRYYDPMGVFLSVDAVGVDTTTAWNFCRYCYAANNPYKFKDPDGRIIDTIADIGFIGYDIYDISQNGWSWTSGTALGADVVGAVVPFATGLGTGVRAAAHASDVAKGVEKAAPKVSKYVEGGKFSKATKETAAERASKACEYCGVKTTPAQKSERGVTPPKNEAQTDHIVPRSQGGTNSPENAAHACRECNQKMSDTPKPNPREKLE